MGKPFKAYQKFHTLGMLRNLFSRLVEHLRNGTAHLSGIAGLWHPRLTALRQERHAFGIQGIAGEKNHPLAQVWILTREDVIESRPVEFWHPQVTEDDVIAPLLEQGQGAIAIVCRVYGGAVTAQDERQCLGESLARRQPLRSSQGHTAAWAPRIGVEERCSSWACPHVSVPENPTQHKNNFS
jgi:hypothetical protein